ncbi:MAG: GtrA family protein [Candidatus Paceibacterota bacterium]
MNLLQKVQNLVLNNSLVKKYSIIFRYVISGGTAAVVDLSLLYLFTDVFNFWYLISATLAFSIAFLVSFTLQKFWTFQDVSKDGMNKQMLAYFVISATNLFVNAGLVYLFVEYFNIYYMLSQIYAALLIACTSFILYRKFIFKGVNL